MPRLRAPSLKQQKFIDAYLETGNATEAALAAGYKCRSRAVAQSIGSENLTKPMIAEALAKHRAEISKRTDITVEQLQRELLDTAEEARAQGKYSAAVAAYSGLLKSVGGFVADRLPPENLAGKALDAKQAEDLRAIAELYYSQKYLAQPIEQPVTRPAEALEGPAMVEQATEQASEAEFAGGDPVSPQAPGG